MATGPARKIMKKGRHLVPVALLAVSVWVLWPQLAALDADAVGAQLAQITLVQWTTALVCTCLSFCAISQYDVIAHRQLDTGADPSTARITGACAIGASQLIGFGAFTATLVRWRRQARATPARAALVTGFVSLMFLWAAIAFAALLWLVLPVPDGFATAAGLGLTACLVAVAAAVIRPRLRIGQFRLDLPGLRAFSAAFMWAGLDMIAAACVLYVLLPIEVRPEFLAFLPVFVIALLIGLYAGTPGGAGPFEVVLIGFTALHQPAATSASALLVAIIAFRAVYFVLPGVIALGMTVRRPVRETVWQDPPSPPLFSAPRAETGVIRQNGGKIAQLGSGHAALWPAGQALVALFDPIGPPGVNFFDDLARKANTRNRTALVYKCNRDTARLARKSGWKCLHIADEAVLDLATYSTDVPERSRLRRKLRQAAKAGVTCRPVLPRDWPALAEIDTVWRTAHGGARGGTMGQFDRQYMSTQVVHVAESDGSLIGFASFHVTGGEWALDVMRHVPDVPQGTMQALVEDVIETAQSRGVPRLSLAALPACPDPRSAIWRTLSTQAVSLSGAAGLRQFKSGFSPSWQPLYAAAPGHISLTIGLLDIAREVFWPSDAPEANQDTALNGDADVSTLHNQDENYEVASVSAA